MNACRQYFKANNKNINKTQTKRIIVKERRKNKNINGFIKSQFLWIRHSNLVTFPCFLSFFINPNPERFTDPVYVMIPPTNPRGHPILRVICTW